jgi:hypothetical protein
MEALSPEVTDVDDEDVRAIGRKGTGQGPSLDGGLPLLLLFSPRRRSRSASRSISAAFSARSNAFSARNASITASPLTADVPSSREGGPSGDAIDTLTRTRP